MSHLVMPSVFVQVNNTGADRGHRGEGESRQQFIRGRRGTAGTILKGGGEIWRFGEVKRVFMLQESEGGERGKGSVLR